ncbi:MAG: hypothetical protein AB9873_03610 [Syntrophobacteraceae bacterium]
MGSLSVQTELNLADTFGWWQVFSVNGGGLAGHSGQSAKAAHSQGFGIKKAIRGYPYGFQYGEGLSEETTGLEFEQQSDQEKEPAQEQEIEQQREQQENSATGTGGTSHELQ